MHFCLNFIYLEEQAMFRLLCVLIGVSLSTSSLAQTSVSDGFAGWCNIPAGGGLYEFTLQGYVTEEGNCSFSNPTQIRGMDALLFDTTCSGDGWVLPDFRTMISTVDEFDDKRAFMMTDGSVVELMACGF